MSKDGASRSLADRSSETVGAPDELLGLLTAIGFGREICGDLAAAERREWWIGNGRGAYAAGTVAQTLTRRYHGLLIAPVDPPLGRCLVLAKADAELVVGDHPGTSLFTNRWAGGAVVPEGHLESSSISTSMAACRSGGSRSATGGSSSASGWSRGPTTTYVAWRQTAAPSRYADARLSVAILANGRDHHGETSPPGLRPGNRRRGRAAHHDRAGPVRVAGPLRRAVRSTRNARGS